MIIFYIRHGDPIYSPDSLTPLGERQAEAVSKRLALYGVDEIYSSTTNRAKLTAKPTAELLKKEIKPLDFCSENHVWKEFAFEDDEGHDWVFKKLRYKPILAGDEIAMLGDKWYDYPEFKGRKFKEGIQRVNKGIDEFLLGLGYEHDRENRLYKVLNPNDKRIAIFAHQGFGISFLSSVLDIPYPIIGIHFDMSHTGMTVIDFKNDDGVSIPKVLTLSNDSHLYREGLPLNYNNELKY